MEAITLNKDVSLIKPILEGASSFSVARLAVKSVVTKLGGGTFTDQLKTSNQEFVSLSINRTSTTDELNKYLTRIAEAYIVSADKRDDVLKELLPLIDKGDIETLVSKLDTSSIQGAEVIDIIAKEIHSRYLAGMYTDTAAKFAASMLADATSSAHCA